MDPLTAFSLAASILQLIDVGVKVVSGSVEIFNSATGTSSLNDEAGLLAGDITVICDQLRNSLRPDGSYNVLNKYETHLEGLRLRSQVLAQELLDKLAKLQVDGEKGMLKRVKSVGMALKIVLKDKSKIDELQKRLDAIRDELETHVVIDMRNSINIMMVAQSEQYSHLDDLNKKMIEALSEAFESNHNKVDVILQAYERKVSGLHEVMKSHISEEHDETRKEITAGRQEFKVTVTAFEENLLSQNQKEHEHTRNKLQEIKDDLVRQIREREAYFYQQQQKLNLKWQNLGEKERKDLTKMQNERVLDISTKIYALESIENEHMLAAGSSSSVGWKVDAYPTPRPLVGQLPVRPKSADMSSESQRHHQVSNHVTVLSTSQSSTNQLLPASGEQGTRRRSLSSAFLQTAVVPRRPMYVFIRLDMDDFEKTLLLQLNIEELHTDVDFFKFFLSALLGYEYSRHVDWDASSQEREVKEGFKRIEFAEFYADDLDHVRVVTRGAVPDADDLRWQYLPKPMDVIPPVGEQMLLDYAREPYYRHARRNILDRIPKTRLRFEELLPDCSGKFWGLNIQHSGEGINYDHVFEYVVENPRRHTELTVSPWGSGSLCLKGAEVTIIE